MPLTSRPSLPLRSHARFAQRPRWRAPVGSLCAAALALAAASSTADTAAALPDLSRLDAAGAASVPVVASVTGAPRAGAADACPYAHLMPTSADASQVAEAIACLVNVQRRAAGLAALAPNVALYAAAQAHSRSMVSAGYFSHTGPAGRSPAQRMMAAGYACHASCWMGENIAWGSGSYATPAAIVRMWMASPDHRANILRRGFRFEGVGAAVGTPSGGWRHRGAATVTEDFGAGS